MPDTNTPRDGDFAAHLDDLAQQRPGEPKPSADPGASDNGTIDGPGDGVPQQTVHQVLVDGEDPTEAFLEEFRALMDAPPLSDEELEQLAMNAPGEDGDVNTPE